MEFNIYLDDDEIGIDPATSNPRYNALAQEKFYFDCTDEFSPFGNDEGAETLFALSDWYRELESDDVVGWMIDRINGFGWDCDVEEACLIADIEGILNLEEQFESFLGCMDHAIIATAFGQYKIIGYIDDELKKLALMAIDRQLLFQQNMLENNVMDIHKIYQIVNLKSTRPDDDGSTNSLAILYISRLENMKNVLSKFELMEYN